MNSPMVRITSIAVLSWAVALACASSPPVFTVSQFTMSGEFTADDWRGVSHERVLQYSDHQVEALVLKIIPSNSRKYEVVTVHYLPGVPLKIGDGWAEPYVSSDAPNGLRTKPEILRGEQRIVWDIHPGDPTGTYRIEVYINGQLIRTLEFEVRDVPPAA